MQTRAQRLGKDDTTVVVDTEERVMED